MGNLVVSDKEYAEMAKQYERIGRNAESFINSYLRSMNTIVSRKLIEGDTARAISAYTLKVVAIKGQLHSIMYDLSRNLGAFVREIDRKDRYLY